MKGSGVGSLQGMSLHVYKVGNKKNQKEQKRGREKQERGRNRQNTGSTKRRQAHFWEGPHVARVSHTPIWGGKNMAPEVSHNQNPVLEWSTQNNVKTQEGGHFHNYFWLGLPLTNLHLPGF